MCLYRVLKSTDDKLGEVRPYKLFKEFSLSTDAEVEDDTFHTIEELIETETSIIDETEKILEKEEEILREARKKAELIIAQAEMKAEEAEKNGYVNGYRKGNEEGFEKGFEEGAEKAKESYEEEISKLRKKVVEEIKEISFEKEKALELYIDDLKSISIAIGEKIIQTSLKSSREVVERMIIAATEKMKKVAWAKIYIGNSTDSIALQGDAEFLRNISKIADSVKVVMIEDEDEGTCIIETAESIIDISVKTQLENIKEIINNARL